MILYWILMTLHVLISICLIVVVLLQSGKGGGLASAFGGAGAAQTMFGGRGAGDFLTRATQILGGAFMVASLSLVLLGGQASRGGGVSGENQQFIEEMREQAMRSQGLPEGVPGGAPGTLPGMTPPPSGAEPGTQAPAGAGEGTAPGSTGSPAAPGQQPSGAGGP